MVKVEALLKFITYCCALTGFACVAQYVEPLYGAGFAALLALSVYFDLKGASLVPRWLLNTLSVAVLLPSMFRVTADYLIEPILNALVVLIAIKLLENKLFRDYMQIFMMCMFCLIGSSLVSFSVVFLLYFFILLAFSTVSLMLLAYFSHDKAMSISRENGVKILQQALIVCCIAIPASSVFFLILPRTNFPLFSFLGKIAHAKSGFSDSVSLGGVADIQEDSALIFRAEMEQIDEASLYWRGVELDEFDGGAWRRSRNPPEAWDEAPPGRQVTQTIYLEPYGNRYLFVLDRPRALYPMGKGSWIKVTNLWPEDIYSRIRYRVVSVPADFGPRAHIDRKRYLQLPPDLSPRIGQLVRDVTGSASGANPVQPLLAYLKTGQYSYSLEGLPVSGSPLEEFLFETKRGNCEYFASALAVMLRSAGIPSRLIGGYRGGYYNRAGGYYMVLQKNAHVWVEAWADGQGWLRLDPTPYTAENPGWAYGESLLLRLKLMVDTLNYYWDKFVISYDLGRQIAILRKIAASFKNPELEIGLSKREMVKYFGFLLAGIAAAAAALAGLRAMLRSREQKLISRFLKRMAARGYRKGKSEGLEEFAARIAQPALREKAQIFVSDFEELFYKDKPFTRDSAARLGRCIRGLG
jgi:protein-glutamine gamma-glutamyltransferase